jgi:hypothetical protein
LRMKKAAGSAGFRSIEGVLSGVAEGWIRIAGRCWRRGGEEVEDKKVQQRRRSSSAVYRTTCKGKSKEGAY